MFGRDYRSDPEFDVFNALGLNPVASRITQNSVNKAWRCVSLHLHPDKLATATHVPAFPTYAQARQAIDFLLGEDKGAANARSRIRSAVASGKRRYRSTWNPWATPNTEDVLKPMPGASTLDTRRTGPVAEDELEDSPTELDDWIDEMMGESLEKKYGFLDCSCQPWS